MEYQKNKKNVRMFCKLIWTSNFCGGAQIVEKLQNTWFYGHPWGKLEKYYRYDYFSREMFYGKESEHKTFNRLVLHGEHIGLVTWYWSCLVFSHFSSSHKNFHEIMDVWNLPQFSVSLWGLEWLRPEREVLRYFTLPGISSRLFLVPLIFAN